MSRAEKIKKALRPPKQKGPNFAEGLSTGSTLLNLGCSSRPDVGFLPGHYYFFVGDSRSGKTFFTLTCMAEATQNPRYQDYRFIRDDPEQGALMNLSRYFGEDVARKLEAPGKGGVSSQTIEEFYFHFDDAVRQGTPFVYVLDSMDGLSSEEEQNKFSERKTAHRKGKEASGSYGDGKAKKNSAGIRQLLPGLKSTGSILIVVNQTRDNIGFGSQFKPKTRSGGHALTFYAALEIWSSVRGTIKKTIRGKDRQLGITTRLKLEKNRITGREVSVQVPILWSHGIDDVGGCVDYLLEEGHWSETKGIIEVPEWQLSEKREGLIQFIEEANLTPELREITAQVWADIEEACAVKRKARY